MTIMNELAKAAYEAWSENKNVGPWDELADFRRWPWRNVARAVLEQAEAINKRGLADKTA